MDPALLGQALMEVICYRSGYKYQLQQPYWTVIALKPDIPIVTEYIKLDETGLLKIARGYAWDGPSGPTFDTKSAMRGSLIHDALYQLMRMQELDRTKFRKRADRIFKLVLLQDGMLPPRAKIWHDMVRLFADPSADPALEKPDTYAPF